MIFAGIFGLLSVVLVVGCMKTTDAPPKKNVDAKAANDAKAKYLLAGEPADAKNVSEIKQKSKDGDEVVVVGIIGGSKQPFTGRGAFTIVDLKVKSCSEMEGDSCPTPWDYCCSPPDEVAKGTLLVKLVDSSGKTVVDDAKDLLSIKELQSVVIKGQIRRDSADSVSVTASGIFIKKQ